MQAKWVTRALDFLSHRDHGIIAHDCGKDEVHLDPRQFAVMEVTSYQTTVDTGSMSVSVACGYLFALEGRPDCSSTTRRWI